MLQLVPSVPPANSTPQPLTQPGAPPHPITLFCARNFARVTAAAGNNVSAGAALGAEFIASYILSIVIFTVAAGCCVAPCVICRLGRCCTLHSSLLLLLPPPPPPPQLPFISRV